MTYRSLENTIRFGPINELSKTHDPRHGKKEKDMNDQVYAGSYRSQHFEVSPDAQRIYSDISKDIAGDKVERSVKTHDELFGILKKVISSGYATKQDVDTAENLSKRIMTVTGDFEVKIDHPHVDKIVDEIKSKYKETPQVVDSITPEELRKRFLNPEKKYITSEPNSDADMDNKKHFHITRAKAIAKKRYLNVGVDEQMSIKELPKGLVESVKKFLEEKKMEKEEETTVKLGKTKFKVEVEDDDDEKEHKGKKKHKEEKEESEHPYVKTNANNNKK